VEAICFTSEWFTSTGPTSSPMPGRKFTTPTGTPACWKHSINFAPMTPLCSAGFITTVLPVTTAATVIPVRIASGKFQGAMTTATPRGRWIGVLAGGFAGAALFALTLEVDLLHALAYGVIEAVTAGSAALIVSRLCPLPLALTRARELAAMIFAGALPLALLGGILATALHIADGGNTPGPTLRVNQGDKVRAIFKNNLKETTGVHFHGVEFDDFFQDGVVFVTQKPIVPGEEYTYEFTANNAGSLKLCCLSKKLRDVFVVTRLDKVFDIHETEAAAVASAEPSPNQPGS